MKKVVKADKSIITGNKLKKRYDAYFRAVLGDLIKEIEQKGDYERVRKGSEKYHIVGELPTEDGYGAMKVKHFTAPVQELVGDANSMVEELAGEVRDWYDNLPESFQSGEKGDALSEAADTLESITLPDFPEKSDILDDENEEGEEPSLLVACYIPSLKCSSRADRASEAAGKYRAAAEGIREYFEQMRNDVEGYEEDGELSSFADDCDSAADEVEGVEFPGMFG